jgi:prolyl 4-hydroxylase
LFCHRLIEPLTEAMAGNPLFRSLSLLVAVVAIGWVFVSFDQSPLQWLRTRYDTNADMPRPQTYVLSEDPVVVYVKDFINTQEAAHLVQLA